MDVFSITTCFDYSISIQEQISMLAERGLRYSIYPWA